MRFVTAATVASLLWLAPPTRGQQGTAFTYQGELTEDGSLATGGYDMVFTLWDANAGGARVGNPVALDEVPVRDGRFAVSLDFGAGPLDGSARWLEAEVEGVALTPRTMLAPSPYALQTRGMFTDENLRVGIGTTAPQHILHTKGDAVLFERAVNDAGVIIRNTSDGVINAFWGLRSTGPNDGQAILTDENVTPLLYLDDGFVGVGRANPVNPYELFGLYRDTVNFGGMYVQTAATGEPFYGYSAGGDVDAYHYFDSATEEWRLVNGAGRLTLTDDGSFGIGTTPGYPLHVESSAHNTVAVLRSSRGAQNDGTLVVRADNTTSGSALRVTADGPSGNTAAIYAASFNRNGSGINAIAAAPGATNYGVRAASYSSTGYDFYAYGPGINYGSSSSVRWKQHIAPIPDPLSLISRLRGVYFDWDAEHGGHHDLGMIAEEVGAVLPELVGYEENGVDALGMDYAKLTPLLVEAVKALRSEMDAEISGLRDEKNAQIAALQDENRSLRARLEALENAVVGLRSRKPAHLP